MSMPPPFDIVAPGRVNLIGEHIDYHNRPVLPMAIGRAVRLRCTQRGDRMITAVSEGAYAQRAFKWTEGIPPYEAGDWGNYIKAAADGAARRWGVRQHGIDCEVSSDLPAAAGLSSSSALVVGVTLALLRANGIDAGFEELMEMLPEAEMYVGTRGGGMDHAACLAGRKGHALLVHFSPVRVEPVPIPENWAFFVAHSLRKAEKSSGVREAFNLRRQLGTSALQKEQAREPMSEGEERCLRHVRTETSRVGQAVEAMHAANLGSFSRLLLESHQSLRDDLEVSCPEADALVEACVAAGAKGARITGAGFGGYVVGVCHARELDDVLRRLKANHYGGRLADPSHLMAVQAADGALACW